MTRFLYILTKFSISVSSQMDTILLSLGTHSIPCAGMPVMIALDWSGFQHEVLLYTIVFCFNVLWYHYIQLLRTLIKHIWSSQRMWPLKLLSRQPTVCCYCCCCCASTALPGKPGPPIIGFKTAVASSNEIYDIWNDTLHQTNKSLTLNFQVPVKVHREN